MIAGYARGMVDEVIMRMVDIFLAFPGLLLNIAIVAVVAKPGLPVFIAALCANGWVGYARVARGQVLSLRERDYVMAARALGASTPRILYRHIAPNLIAPLLVQMSLSFGNVIAAEASLSFLGLGPQVDHTWGAMLEQGTSFLWKPGFRHYALAAAPRSPGWCWPPTCSATACAIASTRASEAAPDAARAAGAPGRAASRRAARVHRRRRDLAGPGRPSSPARSSPPPASAPTRTSASPTAISTASA
jgi:hypothetical protein